MKTNSPEMKDSFEGYIAQLPNDPACYGSDATEEDLERINRSLAAMIEREFPGIEVKKYEGLGKASTIGPDEETRDEIDRWIEENWTAAF